MLIDVYKRQGGGAVGAVSGAEGVVDIHLGQAGQLAGEGLQVLGLFLAETGVLQPVSYTHLDVYKRQPQTRR